MVKVGKSRDTCMLFRNMHVNCKRNNEKNESFCLKGARINVRRIQVREYFFVRGFIVLIFVELPTCINFIKILTPKYKTKK